MAEKTQNQQPENDNKPQSDNSPVEHDIKENLKNFSGAEYEQIENRIQELEKEWDVERSLGLNAAILAITGTVLGISVDKRWFAVPIAVAAFTGQYAIQGWNPLFPLFRKFGFRTSREIDQEKYALKALRGDFKRIGQSHNKAWKAVSS